MDQDKQEESSINLSLDCVWGVRDYHWELILERERTEKLEIFTHYPALYADVRVEPERRLGAEKLMFSNCGAREHS